jgi:alkanesulfonate monooxygenase SsuD/methylene tetrahydromethanopterin reductase-like flavin-dependent oxidoreductase (luciferase family)
MAAPVIALVQPADQPPDRMLEAARAAEAAGLEEVWLWEDCFAASGVAPAAAILAATGLRVGVGLFPAPLRVPSLAAMEIATLAAMFPGRFLPGLGHGVQEWMEQVGVRADSPLTLLREHLVAVSALLRGEEVTSRGQYAVLERVRLRFPPQVPPPLLVGGRGPRTLSLAGELADGVILDDVVDRTGAARPDRVREVLDLVGAARAAAGRQGATEVVAFLPTPTGATAESVAEQAAVLGEAGVTRVAAFAGGVDGPPASGGALLTFVDVLAEAAARLGPPPTR